MLDSFFDGICRVGIFVMCAQTIVHFKPKEVYEKYLRYLVSIMVLIQLFLPLGSFLLGGGSAELTQALKEFERELQKSMEAAEESAREADARLEAMTLEEVRKQMEATGQAAQEGTDSTGQEEVQNENQRYGTSAENQEIKVEIIDPITIGD